MIQQNPLFNKIFTNPQSIISKSNENLLNRGGVLIFNYSYWKHDPYPLIMISDYVLGIRIRGINLHYLTYPVISTILSQNCDNKAFSYSNISQNNYIKSAFRTYKWSGVRQIKKLDCKILLKMISGVRSLDPTQVQTIRQSIEDQLQRTTNPNLENEPSMVPSVQQTPIVGQENG